MGFSGAAQRHLSVIGLASLAIVDPTDATSFTVRTEPPFARTRVRRQLKVSEIVSGHSGMSKRPSCAAIPGSTASVSQGRRP
jgi:hypothetical protein